MRPICCHRPMTHEPCHHQWTITPSYLGLARVIYVFILGLCLRSPFFHIHLHILIPLSTCTNLSHDLPIFLSYLSIRGGDIVAANTHTGSFCMSSPCPVLALVRPPRLPIAGAHVMPPEGGRWLAVTVTSKSRLCGGSSWTVTGQLLDFFCALIRPYECISHPSIGLCDHYAASYGSGREPCTAKVSSPRLRVAPGSFSTQFTG
jgi:hypothetical protein